MANVTWTQFTPKGGGEGSATISGMTLENGDVLLSALASAGDKARTAGARALRTVAELIMTDAKRITPVEHGNLRNSGHVQDVKEIGDRLEVALGFGGPAAPYAIYVHERMDLRHKAGTSAKFLERPMLAWASKIEAQMASLIRGELEAVGQ
jgi:hypothetical protein